MTNQNVSVEVPAHRKREGDLVFFVRQDAFRDEEKNVVDANGRSVSKKFQICAWRP